MGMGVFEASALGAEPLAPGVLDDDCEGLADAEAVPLADGVALGFVAISEPVGRGSSVTCG